jgi:hypothetical protein
MWVVTEARRGMWFAGRSRSGSMCLLFSSRDEAQDFCDRVNESNALEARKNTALDWALDPANGVPDEELHAAINTPGGIGLLDFEPRMADTPIVVGG